MKSKPRLNQKISTTIQRLGIHGEGIGYWNGYTVFVDGALPGESVQAQLVEQKKRYGRAKLDRIETPSASRVEPPCPLFGKCGGCQLMHLDAVPQLEVKRQRVVDAFDRIGKLGPVEVSPCIPSPSPLQYRNKIQVPIRNREGGLDIGFNARGSHDLVPVDFCHIHCPLGQKVYEKVLAILKCSSLNAYEWNTREGELRYLIIKTAVHTEQVLVVFVTSGPASEELKKAAKHIMETCPEVKGVVQNINGAHDNVVLGAEFRVLAGEGSIEEKIAGLRFKVSPASFFQVNPRQAENLYRTALRFAELTGTETVLDAYCGVGTMSLIFSRSAANVIGVECVAEAIEDAKKNARNNEVWNTEFHCAQAEQFIQTLEQIDVAVLNPPRKGCDPLLLNRIGTLKPKRIIYVSCDPATLARDLATLQSIGYVIGKIQPFDMFPQTSHVETAVQLSC